MDAPELWIRFLGDRSTNEARPALCLKRATGEVELVIKPRDRTFIAALAVPRAMAARDHGTGRELPVLSSQEICDRTSSDRSIIGRALRDLAEILSEHDLRLDDYVLANRRDSQYGLRSARVDVVELLAARDAPDLADKLLGEIIDRQASVGLAQASRALFSAAALTEIDAVLEHAVERRTTANQVIAEASAPTGAEMDTTEPPASQTEQGRARAAAPAAAEREVGERGDSKLDGRHRRRVPTWAIAVTGVAVFAVVVAAVIAVSGGAGSGNTPPGPGTPGRFEITGSSARAWSNYENAGGTPGAPLSEHQRVYITCRVRGFQAGGTNPWWYRLGQSPWSNRFYSSADAFFNNGQHSGPLKGTPKVDPRVPACP
jgi:hypothetical protein